MGGAGMNNGPAMMFVDLLPHKAPDGMAWKPKDIDLLNRRWTQVGWVVGFKLRRTYARPRDPLLSTPLTPSINSTRSIRHR